jgi:hypothetical protein
VSKERSVIELGEGVLVANRLVQARTRTTGIARPAGIAQTLKNASRSVSITSWLVVPIPCG